MDFDTSELFVGDDTDLEFNIGDFDLVDTNPAKTDFLKPRFCNKPLGVRYENAVELVNKIKLFPGEQIHSVVPGNFVFGDFLEALLVKKNAECKKMYLSTLSYSQENADSLAGLIHDGYIQDLTLMVSNYFYSHEKWRLLKYLRDAVGEAFLDRLDIIVVRNHTKICLMDIPNIKVVLSGSSNLRSSNSLEQFVLQESQELYKFYQDWFEGFRGFSIMRRDT